MEAVCRLELGSQLFSGSLGDLRHVPSLASISLLAGPEQEVQITVSVGLGAKPGRVGEGWPLGVEALEGPESPGHPGNTAQLREQSFGQIWVQCSQILQFFKRNQKCDISVKISLKVGNNSKFKASREANETSKTGLQLWVFSSLS